jgi:hypothetical protein
MLGLGLLVIIEPYRVSRGLQALSQWGHDEEEDFEPIFT